MCKWTTIFHMFPIWALQDGICQCFVFNQMGKKSINVRLNFIQSVVCKIRRSDFYMFSLRLLSLSLYLSPPLSTSPHAAKEYVDSDPSGRRGLPITTIKQGAEPPTFTGWFQAWDPKMWESDPLDRIRARFWTQNSRLFLPVWLLTYPALPIATLFILPPIPKCQNQCYHCNQVEWLPLCLCLGAVH